MVGVVDIFRIHGFNVFRGCPRDTQFPGSKDRAVHVPRLDCTAEGWSEGSDRDKLDIPLVPY